MKTARHRCSKTQAVTAVRPGHQPGTALIVVLVVIVLLSLGALTFSSSMITEYRASRNAGLQLTSKAWAESGVEYVAALLGPDNGGATEIDLYDNPSVFLRPMGTGGFSIQSPIEDELYTGSGESTGTTLRYGLIDECAKLNLNLLASFDPSSNQGQDMLMALPNMTLEAADAILDWIDADDDPREFGVDGSDYTFVMPRNGPLQSLEELVLVSGVTPELLFGEDANRNGILDPNENDGEASLPYDNADGVLDLGWSEFITVYSQETNVRKDPDFFGEEKIFVNESILADLYDEIEEKVGLPEAQFIIAIRKYGPMNVYAQPEADSADGGGTGSSGMGGFTGGTGIQTPVNTGAGNTSTGNSATDQSLQQIANSLASGFAAATGGTVTKGGIDITQGASYTMTSLYELVDAQVEAEVDGQNVILVSPWTTGNLSDTLPLLLDTFSVTEDTVIRGRININQARREVLASIPGMPESLPDAIISARSSSASTGRGSSLDIYGVNGWILQQGLVDVPTMQLLDPFITARGDVFRFQVVAHAENGPVTRVEAVIDATQTIPKVVYRRDLAPLGPGFRKEQLPVFSAP